MNTHLAPYRTVPWVFALGESGTGAQCTPIASPGEHWPAQICFAHVEPKGLVNTVCSVRSCHVGTYHFSCSDERTTDTEEAAMAAEPIHGCSTMPKGMKTPAKGRTTLTLQPRGKSKESTHHEVLLLRVAQKPLMWDHMLTGL